MYRSYSVHKPMDAVWTYTYIYYKPDKNSDRRSHGQQYENYVKWKCLYKKLLKT